MLSFSRITIFFCLIPCALAIDCYKELIKNKGKPKSKIACATGTYCKKFTEKIGKDEVHRYGCGWEIYGQEQACTKDGCIKFKETTTCCCSKSLCNGSSQLPTFLSFVTIIIVKFII